MPEPDFGSFHERLFAQGIAYRYAARLAQELAEHYEDLRIEAERAGMDPAAAAFMAEERLGSVDHVAEAASRHPELKSWSYRYPQVARIVLPIAFVALLPVAPFAAGLAHAGSIARWTCCAMLSAMFTAMLLLCMQLSIALG